VNFKAGSKITAIIWQFVRYFFFIFFTLSPLNKELPTPLVTKKNLGT
jgi:hypothetical protein